MLNSIFAQGNLTLGNVLLALGLALGLGFLSALLYIRRCKDSSQSFALTLVVLPLVTATVIMVVNGNLGAGIAVAGSFSLIRFRSVQGSAQEILAVFLSASLGLCLGAGYVVVACLLLGLYALATLVLYGLHFGSDMDARRELRISIPEVLDYEGLFDDLLSEQFQSCELERVRTIEMGTVYQLIYRVTLRQDKPAKAFLDEVRVRNGNLPVSLGKIPDSRSEL